MPTIKGSPSIGPLKDAYQEELLRFLDSRESPKAIYWQRAAIAPVNLIVGHSVLKEHGVCHSFMIDTQDFCPPPPTVKTVFFVLHSDLKVVDIVRNFLKQYVLPLVLTILFREFSTKTSPSSRDYCIIAIPSFSLVCRTFLKEMQVYDKLAAIYELPLTLLPIDSDLLSMEDPECFAVSSIAPHSLIHFQDFALRDKETCLFNLARGLIKFQAVFGLFPRIRAKGPKAKRVASMLVQMRHEATVSASLDVSECATSHLLESPGQAHLLILIDRSVDLLTPCLSQLTYHGLLAEVWPVKYGSLKLPTSDASGQKSQRIVLNSSDSLFGEICDQNFASVGPILSKRTKELSTILNETKASKELATLKRLVGQLPELRQLHASASQHFLAGFETDRAHPLIEQRILQLAPIEEVLRLICIQSFCNGGLKQRLLDFYRHEILQSYGFEHMLTLDNLERLGLLGECSRIASLPQTSSTAFQSSDLLDRDRTSDVRRTVAAVSSVYASSLRRSLRLQVAPDPPNAPTSLDGSLSHLLGGTVPISVRLVQAMALGWPSRALNTLTAATVTGGTPIGGALSAASSMANNAIQAGRRLVSGGTVGSPVVATTSSSSGGYVTSLLHTVEVDEVQVPGEFSKSSGGEGVTATKMGAGVGGRDVTRTVVVAFVGGITHSEVAALRKIAAADEGMMSIGLFYATFCFYCTSKAFHGTERATPFDRTTILLTLIS
ncbi:unnamed protein product [Schistocephalus solidus]|uniref:Vacuolar protein sorting-associated protein 33A n=1 Tax=Schistocephalus solidus TaxID=70667 RepID=A0A183SJI0_SCHSO|nr:unnamed protein product [Schistocephalus solidus]